MIYCCFVCVVQEKNVSLQQTWRRDYLKKNCWMFSNSFTRKMFNLTYCITIPVVICASNCNMQVEHFLPVILHHSRTDEMHCEMYNNVPNLLVHRRVWGETVLVTGCVGKIFCLILLNDTWLSSVIDITYPKKSVPPGEIKSFLVNSFSVENVFLSCCRYTHLLHKHLSISLEYISL